MKKIIFLLVILFGLAFSACSSDEKQPEEIKPVVQEQQNEPIVSDNTSLTKEILNNAKFNTNLKDFEQKWLSYLEEKNPNSKIYHVRTVNINCDDCYEVYYKKDLSMIKIKVLNGEKKQETTIVDDLFTEIKDSDVCDLYGGNWNECPRICPTDEEICTSVCGEPACELDQTTVNYKKLGEQCGSDLGDCEFGFSCYYQSNDADYGICK